MGGTTYFEHHFDQKIVLYFTNRDGHQLTEIISYYQQVG
jgi:hypothetical protein